MDIRIASGLGFLWLMLPWLFIYRSSCGTAMLLRGNQLTPWKSPWCWERSRPEGEEGIRRWDGRMASLIGWIWTWTNTGRWWGAGKPGVLPSIGCKESDMAGQLNPGASFIGSAAETSQLGEPGRGAWQVLTSICSPLMSAPVFSESQVLIRNIGLGAGRNKGRCNALM